MEVDRQNDTSVAGNPSRSASRQATNFTVIVPAYNPGEDLKRCLEALAQSTYQQFDVVVVDDGSTEPIEPLVERLGYRYIRIDGPSGPARARNLGVEQVDSEFVVFIDADVCVHPDTIERFAASFAADKDLAAVIGSYDDSPADPGFLSQYRNMFHHYTHCRSAGQITTFWSGCGAMRRDIFVKYGGFDEQRYRRPAIEDIELGTWIAADGGKIVLDPNIQCKHLKNWSFSNMVRTDIFQRGIPWIDLMLRSSKAVKTLNVTGSQRLSVGLIFAALALMIVGIWWRWALIGAAVAAITVTILNVDLYRFFASRRGLLFAAKSLLFHWLYFICCGLSVIIGTLQFHCKSRNKPSSAECSDVSQERSAV